MNAPLVPDPSSLEQIVISPEAAAIAVVPIVATPNNAAIATAKPFFIVLNSPFLRGPYVFYLSRDYSCILMFGCKMH